MVTVGADIFVFRIDATAATSDLSNVSSISRLLEDRLNVVMYIREGDYVRIKISMKERQPYPVRIIPLRDNINIKYYEFTNN